jgi:hypothetical protein
MIHYGNSFFEVYFAMILLIILQDGKKANRVSPRPMKNVGLRRKIGQSDTITAGYQEKHMTNILKCCKKSEKNM